MREQDLVADWLIEHIAEMIERDPDSISVDASFTELGLSSVQAVELAGELEKWVKVTLPPTLAYDCPTIDAATAFVVEEAQRNGRTITRAGASEGGS